MYNYIIVGLGGALGCMLRYFLWVNVLSGRAGAATLLANVLASVVLGVVVGYINIHPQTTVRLLVVVGFCGGLSTFSTFSYETLQFIFAQKYDIALQNVITNIAGTVLAIAAGMWAAQKIF
jgi:CrcB protein